MKSSTKEILLFLILTIVKSSGINVKMLSKHVFRFLSPATATIRSSSSTVVSTFVCSSPIAIPIHSNTHAFPSQTSLFSINRGQGDLLSSHTTLDQSKSDYSFSDELMERVHTISDSGIVSALKVWRKRTSDELQVPLYRVLTNNVIDLIATKRPRTLLELRTLNGIGDAKMKKYGPRIIELVKALESGMSASKLSVETIPLSPEDEKYLQDADAAAKLQKKKKAVTEKKILKTVKKLSKKGANETAIILSIEQLREEAKRSDGFMTFSELNNEQQNAAKQALLGKNVFITGSAGTGNNDNYDSMNVFPACSHHIHTCIHIYIHR